ncbi:calpain-like cysteine peptidase, putative [Leishmania donovani]|uniref:Calpain-like cysteine peptidase, putative n=1 Tax=Leishmania donovani TaxID=5661 RepID=A0A3S7X460_LEIDO|nr:calpain-like cysteine peptidase, putative [Leishmania donovani]
MGTRRRRTIFCAASLLVVVVSLWPRQYRFLCLLFRFHGSVRIRHGITAILILLLFRLSPAPTQLQWFQRLMALCGGSRITSKAGKHYQQKKVHDFKYGGPAVKGDCYPLFEDGRCYRVEVDRHKWFLYNDSLDMEMHVTFTFQKTTAVYKTQHGRTTVRKTPNGGTQCSVVVYPLETLPYVKFAKKTQILYSAACMSRDLAPGYIEKINREAKAKCMNETQKVAGVAGVSRSEEEILYKCRKSKIPYIDMRFHPSEAALRRPHDKQSVSNMHAITWKRPQDYIPAIAHKEIKLFRHGVSAAGIGQGHLGDCWLMCSIAVVAESKTMVKDIFRHPVSQSQRKKEERAGGYRVYINKNGWFHNVIVDSYLPTYNGAVYFARSAGDPYELWVSLLEKAYAKLHGSYASIVGGNPLHALQDLTGFPVYSFTNAWKAAANGEEAASQFFKDLLRYRKNGYLISISTPGTQTSLHNAGSGNANEASLEARYKAAGLSTGHSYSVLKVRQFVIPRVKLLKIRNPWGSGDEWTGAWGKNSTKWQKHSLVRRSCKPSKVSDGTFWIEWRDAVQFFEGGGVCMVKKAWYQYRFPGQFIGIIPSVVLKIELKKQQKMLFTLSQKDRRLRSPDDPDQLYKGLLISVTGHNMEKGMQQIVALSTDNPEVHPPEKYEYMLARDVGLELELDPAQGPFYVIPRIMATNQNGPMDFTLGMLTPSKSTARGLRVSFVHLPDTCPTFRNLASFHVNGEVATHVQFQYKKRGGAPRVKAGITVFEATNVKQTYPFQ